MDNTSPQDNSKIILRTMEDDLKASNSSVSPTGPTSSHPSGVETQQPSPPPPAPPPLATHEPLPSPLPASKVSMSAPLPAAPQITIPEFNPLKRRIMIISTFVAITLVVFGLGVGVFFWFKNRSSQVIVATPTPLVQESPVFSLSPSNIVYPNPVILFDGAAVIEYSSTDNISQVLVSKIPLIAQEGKAIRILLRQMDYSEGPRFTYLSNILNSMGAKINSELSGLMTNSGDLFVYEDNGKYRLGFVSSLSVLESYASLSSGLRKIEGEFLSDFAPMFLSANFQTPALKNFQVNTTLSPNFVNRYINLVSLPQNNLSLDYAINKAATLFVLATSKNSMFHVINLIKNNSVNNISNNNNIKTKTYNDPGGYYSFQYPSQWFITERVKSKLKEGSNDSVVSLIISNFKDVSGKGNFNANEMWGEFTIENRCITIINTDGSQKYSCIDDLEKAIKTGGSAINIKRLSIDGKEAVEGDAFSMNDLGNAISSPTTKVVMIKGKDYVVRIYYYYGKNPQSVLSKDFDEIIQSIKFN